VQDEERFLARGVVRGPWWTGGEAISGQAGGGGGGARALARVEERVWLLLIHDCDL
jgi:hypothetical protein